MDLLIKQAKSIRGTIEVPGDKSISHRALIFGSLCEGGVEITNFLQAEDCLSTLKCLQDLGVKIERSAGNVLVQGVGKYGFKTPKKPLSVGNSGTTLRILPGLLAAQPFESTLIGDESVSKRPMDRVIKPLREMGANIESTDGHAPIHILPPHPNPLPVRPCLPTGRQAGLPRGRGNNKLSAISYQLPVASAQVKSAILLAGLFAEGQTTVSEKYKSRDHTERMLKYLGADLSYYSLPRRAGSPSTPKKARSANGPYMGGLGWGRMIDGNSTLIAKPIQIPGDISSAAFFIIAALLLEKSELLIKDLGVNPTRTGLLNVLEASGAFIKSQNERQVCGEPVADLKISNIKSQTANVKPLTIGAKDIPGLVDEIPVLAVLATQITGTSVISGAQELRVKETDRLKAISAELRKMGANIEEKSDGLVVHGLSKLRGTVVDSGGDHRMAMSLAIAGLIADGETTIKGAESIDISFPGFSKLVDKITKASS